MNGSPQTPPTQQRLQAPRGSPRAAQHGTTAFSCLAFVRRSTRSFVILLVLFGVVLQFFLRPIEPSHESPAVNSNEAPTLPHNGLSGLSSVDRTSLDESTLTPDRSDIPIDSKSVATATSNTLTTTTTTTASPLENIGAVKTLPPTASPSSEPDPEKHNLVTEHTPAYRKQTSTHKTSTTDDYRPSKHPLFDPSEHKPSRSSPVLVHLLTDISKSVQLQSKVILAGVLRSHYTKLDTILYMQWGHIQQTKSFVQQKSEKSPTVLLVDWSSLKRDCHVLQRVLQQHPFQRVLLMDYSASNSQHTCSDTLQKQQQQQQRTTIRLAKRNIVVERSFNRTTNWIDVGRIADNQNELTMQLPHVVRDLFVDAIHNATRDPFQERRPIAVSHFWDHKDYAHYGFFRRVVSDIVKSRQNSKAGTKRVSTMVGETKYMRDYEETGNIQESYIRHVLETKVIVVAQRDTSEDHYRLMDSLASGALVMTDVMLSLPEGLQNATNILVYDSPQSLKNFIRYYLDPKHESQRLSIARQGYELAMGRHRSWHRIEELLFGKPLTLVDEPYARPPSSQLERILQTAFQ